LFPSKYPPHADQVNHAFEAILGADGDLHRNGVQVQLLPQLPGHALRVGTRAVQLVDESDARHLVAPHLAIDRVRL